MQPYYTSAARQSPSQLHHLIERLAHERDMLAQRFNHAQQQLVALKRQQQQQQEQSAYALNQARQQLQSLDAQNQSLRAQLDDLALQAPPASPGPAQEQASPQAKPEAPQDDATASVAASLSADALFELIALRDQLDGALAMSQDPANPWHQGIAHLLAQFDATLERQGLSRFARPGDDFDPNIHEAIATDHAQDMGSGKLLRVIKPGFSFKRDGALARTAQVVVSR